MRRHATGVPEGSPHLDVLGVRLAVADEGRGPAVVCLHAIGHGGGDFAALAAALRGDFRVIRIDWPGQGRSGPDSAPPTPERYAELLAAVLDRLQVRDPIIVGNSIGGAAALLHAGRRPVRGLVLCDSGGLVPVSGFVRAFCGAFAAFFRAGARGARWFPWAFRLYYRWFVLPAAAAREQRERIIAAGPEIAGVLADAWTGFGRPEADLRALAQRLDVPVWIAWSRGDRVIPYWMCRPCIRRMKHARVELFAGGHAAFLEQPGAFVEGFRRFAASLATARARAAA